MSTSNELAAAVGLAASNELSKILGRIQHCLAQLTDEQVWFRPSQDMNSVGNLMLHVAGNLRQWIVAGLGGAMDVRDRPREFAERGPIARDKMLQALKATIEEAGSVLAKVTDENLLAVRRIQKYEVNGLAALFNSVSHFQGHAQEIIHMTRNLLGDAYKFTGPPPPSR